MNAGRLTLHGKTFRVVADTTALGRITACASLGLDGREGVAATNLFLRTVVDPRDRPRWARAAAGATDAELINASATCIGLILAATEATGDADDREWVASFRDAIRAFQGGDTSAFARLAEQNAARWGGGL